MPAYRPTHCLLVRHGAVGTPAYERLVAAAFEAGAGCADEARFRLDRDLIADDHPDLIGRLDESFERRDDASATVFHTRDLDRALSVLPNVLALRAPAVVGVRELRLALDGERCLQFVPDHTQLTCSDADGEPPGVAPGIAAAVADAVADEPAILLPAAPLAEWEYDGAAYSLGRSLCVEPDGFSVPDGACYRLGRLEDVTPDEDALAIDLHWSSLDVGVVGRTIARAADALGWTRPETLQFASPEDFSAAGNALVRIVDGLEGNRGVVDASSV